MFMIALSSDNQWTVEWYAWLPYKSNQFHVQLVFLSKKHLRGKEKSFCQRSEILIHVE